MQTLFIDIFCYFFIWNEHWRSIGILVSALWNIYVMWNKPPITLIANMRIAMALILTYLWFSEGFWYPHYSGLILFATYLYETEILGQERVSFSRIPITNPVYIMQYAMMTYGKISSLYLIVGILYEVISPGGVIGPLLTLFYMFNMTKPSTTRTIYCSFILRRVSVLHPLGIIVSEIAKFRYEYPRSYHHFQLLCIICQIFLWCIGQELLVIVVWITWEYYTIWTFPENKIYQIA
jgi:hypothetical protein